MDRARSTSRPALAVGLIKNLGERLVKEARAPYETQDHDEAVNFDEPTGDFVPRTGARAATAASTGTES
jgi:hypothetical protein